MADQHKQVDSLNLIKNSRHMLDKLNIGFVLVDMEGNNLEVNDTWLKMTGFTREQTIGHNASEFYDEDDYEMLLDIVNDLQEQAYYQFEHHLKTVHGHKIPTLFNVSRNLDNNGNPDSLIMLATDINEQKKIQDELEAMNLALQASKESLEIEKQKLETILFGIADCVTIFDHNGKFLFSNPRGQKMRGRRKTPFLPLEPGKQGPVSVTAGSETYNFWAQIEAVLDHKESVYAYVETLKDKTDEIKLINREKELSQIKHELKHSHLRSQLIGVSMEMVKIYDLIIRFAEADSTVLIMGETGVGKELVARAIHTSGPKKDKPFVTINCGAIPETLLESELFGYKKGAFTGAAKDHTGLFMEANGGTLFLDEVGDLSKALQVKLLRALQEKEIRPVGSSKSYPVEVRVICATNKDIGKMVRENHFRKDLYYRIAVLQLTIPPLRERKADILPLAEHFIKEHQREGMGKPKALDTGAQQVLLEHVWPGNIRELENCIEHALVMAPNDIITPGDLSIQTMHQEILEDDYESLPHLDPEMHTADHQPGFLSTTNKGLLPKLSSSYEEAEKKEIVSALKRYNGNRTKAAKDLGISRVTLWRKMSMYRLAG